MMVPSRSQSSCPGLGAHPLLSQVSDTLGLVPGWWVTLGSRHHNSHSRATKKLPAVARGLQRMHMKYQYVCVKGRALGLFSSLWMRGIWEPFCCCVNDGRVHLFFPKGKKKNKHKTKPCLSCLSHWVTLINITRLTFKVTHKQVY